MSTKSLLLLILFFICGCTTVEFVRKDISPEKRAILRHSLPSTTKRDNEYREEVRKKAAEFCGGDFHITREYQAREPANSSVGVGTGFNVGGNSSVFVGGSDRSTAMYTFIEVKCD